MTNDLLEGLMAAGYHVRFYPGSFDPKTQEYTPEGTTVVIESREAVKMGRLGESWSAHDITPDRALIGAANQLYNHIRPAYEGYLAVAEAMGWER
jgi:hypothetical protein